ncbi:MAG: ATP synthase F0 subunit B [Leptolyngbya sp.]|nr:ATP synthase F0 subunit B [Leptolyngbya sp.]
MLRPDLTPDGGQEAPPSRPANVAAPPPVEDTVRRLDIQQSLNVLEELILGSPRVPFSRRTLVDEDQLLEQLDRIRLNLPTAFQEAVQIVNQRNTILAEADRYARELRAAADQEAAQRLDDLGILRQAEAEAQYLKQQTQQECEALRAKARAELEEWQAAAQAYWEQMRQTTETDCTNLQEEADTYAAQVLTSIEQQLKDMLRVVHNGRQALGTGEPASSASTNGAGPETTRRRDTPPPSGKSAPRSDGRSRRTSS